MTISQSWLNSAGLILLAAIVGLFITWYWRVRDARIKQAEKATLDTQKKADELAMENATLLKRVDELEKNMTVVNQVAVPLNQAYMAMLIKQLTHLHTPKLDALMTKLGPPSTLTPDEEIEFAVLLKERAEALDGRIDESERDAAIMLPMVLKRAKKEHEDLTIGPVELTVVATPLDTSGQAADTGAEAVEEKHEEEGA